MTKQTPDASIKADVEKTGARAEQGVIEGVADAKRAAELLPALHEPVTKFIYGGCYYAAYYVTFGALAIAQLIPAGSAAARGLHDGADAAARGFKAYQEQQARLGTAPAAREGADG
jgi:hypothetical protein